MGLGAVPGSFYKGFDGFLRRFWEGWEWLPAVLKGLKRFHGDFGGPPGRGRLAAGGFQALYEECERRYSC